MDKKYTINYFRNEEVFSSKETAIAALRAQSSLGDGEIALARYIDDGGNIITLLGIMAKIGGKSYITIFDSTGSIDPDDPGNQWVNTYSWSGGTSIRMIINASNGITGTSYTATESPAGFDEAITSLQNAFSGQTEVVRLNLNNLHTTNATSASNAFYGCSRLTRLKCNKFIHSKVTTINSIFRGCTSLVDLDLSTWDVSSCTDMTRLFYGCTSLETIDMSNWNISSNTLYYRRTFGSDSRYAFYGCSSLKEIKVPIVTQQPQLRL